MAYVYVHIRLDNNQPFYIGIGSDRNYARAETDKGRNRYWNNIVKKAGFSVDIMEDGISWDDACAREIYYISIYKRKNDGGILCNLTLGGEGKLGVTPTNAFPKGHVPYMKGRKVPKEQIEKLAAFNRGRPSHMKGKTQKKESIEKFKQTMLKKGWKKGEDHPRFGKTHSDELKARWRITRKGIAPPNKGIPMKNKNNHPLVIKNKGRSECVFQYTLQGDFISKYNSITEAGEKTGLSKGNIWHVMKGVRKSSGGFVFKNQPLEVE